jgi:xanthine dehydrogenase accessory factor
LEFLIGRQALSRTDLAYVGMIGSKTKRATFASFLEREGVGREVIEGLTLPIGGQTVKDKRPAVIAAMVAAELLGVLQKA